MASIEPKSKKAKIDTLISSFFQRANSPPRSKRRRSSSPQCPSTVDSLEIADDEPFSSENVVDSTVSPRLHQRERSPNLLALNPKDQGHDKMNIDYSQDFIPELAISHSQVRAEWKEERTENRSEENQLDVDDAEENEGEDEDASFVEDEGEAEDSSYAEGTKPSTRTAKGSKLSPEVENSSDSSDSDSSESSDESLEPSGLNSYEKERLAKIERNQKRLEELGLGAPLISKKVFVNLLKSS